ncbi:hypothetical protein [Phenylobacterium sp. J367]|uniref:hypothetical protein n=1 Tax=Phenylobacterium sp. J367 TaxID=2898435 RepID=UPI0021509580|nr:hypothetical protein [Phenylobacterium sp. J367]MCR5876990.1 hypothetical protein [Phenylobacterium sp. J367]
MFGGGVAEGVAGLADMVMTANPFASSLAMFEDAAIAADVLKGKLPTRVTGNPFSGFAEAAQRGAPKPQTKEEEYLRTIGQNVPNALAPGGAAQRAVNVFAPAIASETAGQVAREAGAGPRGETAARVVGGLAGSAVASVRVPARRAPPTPAETFATRAKPDVPAMRQRAEEMRAAGVEPTLVDVAGERGRRMIRAVGVKGEEAGEALTANASTRSADAKPASMAAARRLTPDQRSANQYADDMERVRGQQAAENYGQFDADQIEVPDTVLDMLSDSAGRSIIARARADAIENQDWGRQVELDRLLQMPDRGGVGPIPRVSAGTIDRLVIAARERGAAFARRGNNNRARGALARRDQLDQTLEGVEGLRPARETYRNQSRAIEVARGENRLDPLSTDPRDYAAWVRSLPPEAQEANRVAIRQQILDTLGKQRENSFGALDQLTSSQYARQNLSAAFGDGADRFLNEVGARVAQARNAQFVQPNAGSRTAVLANDVGNQAQQTVGAVRQGLSGDVIGLAARAIDMWRGRGLSEQQARELAMMAVDPNQTDAAIQAIAARLAPRERQEFLSLRNAIGVGAIAGATASRPAAAEEPRRR